MDNTFFNFFQHKENCPSDTLFETMHIFNSIAEAKTNWQSVEWIVLNVLDGSPYFSYFNCCLFGENMLSIHRSEASIKNTHIQGSALPELTARQYMCSTKHITFKPVYVGLVEYGMPCDPCITVKPVIYPIIKEHGTAVCAKIAFNHLNPGHLIEWFEYQKLMYVDTIVVMLQYLNDEALKVLTFYARQGFLKILPYPAVLPGQTGNILCISIYNNLMRSYYIPTKTLRLLSMLTSYIYRADKQLNFIGKLQKVIYR